ncbi:metal ABC transporter solute-binding protein, Zn/Mn family [Roseibacillus persicicus]|uniref:metal ABC transporter solute-binding protein, Zn/Mn family n=1 Tax=Roseibacillus persicicus TaxID=454148 RepID=UPI001676364D|nr:zinc ABC transporter substrate-binding protein [Roseibacillus persicicus]
MLQKTTSLIAALASLLLLSQCRKAEQTGNTGPSQYPVPITATTGMITDLVRQVGGEHVEVTGLIGEGIDPHLYKPTRSDLVALSGADVIFYNGLKLEGKMEDTLMKMGKRGKPVVAITRDLQKKNDYLMGGTAHPDPHVWMDVSGWLTTVTTVADELSAFDPKHAENYSQNAQALSQELEALDQYARESLATIPPGQRVLVTAHDAFGYLGRAYGIEVKGIQGISTESEAGVKDIENLVNYLVERKIPAVFVESSVSDQNVKALLEGAKARGHQVRIGGKLFSDAMGPTGTYEGTYLGMIDHNVTTITRALGGTAPAKGLNGKLSSQ